MSWDFRVHNFDNCDLAELEDMKQDFDYLWDQAHTFKSAEADLPNHNSYEEWLKVWECCGCDDEDLYELAEEYYKEKSEVSK